MAHGRPDFFGTSIHPKFGSSRTVKDDVAIAALGENELVTVKAKGITYGGTIYIKGLNASNNDDIYIYCDGLLLAKISFLTLYLRGMFGDTDFPLTLLYYDNDTLTYIVNIQKNITFETSLKLSYGTTNALNRVVTYHLSYSSIE